jgi:hypothetical protein
VPAHASQRLTALFVALAVSTGGLSSAPASGFEPAAAAGAAAESSGTVDGCRVPLLDRAARGSEVKAASTDALVAFAQVNDLTVRELSAEVSRDRTLWLDTCGRAFHIERTAPSATTDGSTDHLAVSGQSVTAAQSGAATDPGPLSAAFALESKPGATKTIYLDFDGETVTGTGWNETYEQPVLAVAPYSLSAPVDTNFSDAELTQIQRAWQTVAEDFAPFDVNVSTKTPVPGAIERSGPADLIYGTRVLVSGGGPIYDDCRCGGVAYVDTFSSTSDHGYYQPAWVFTNGSTTDGKRVGETASHEAGHNLGLGHDGVNASTYYSGSPPWAPIMGTGNGQPVTHWSAGEYPGATNTEDDLSIIAGHLPLRVDDHQGTQVGATVLSRDVSLEGVITTRADRDAFTFVGAGMTTIEATPGPGFPDLDIGLRILDGSGASIAYVDPAVVRTSSSVAGGLGAIWSAVLPETAAVYTAVVDGVGSGNPTTAGNYSDYASLGNYRVALGNDASIAEDLAATSTAPVSGTVGMVYSATPAAAAGGTQPYSWAAMSALPPGLALNPASAALSGTPTTAGSTPVTLTVTDATGDVATTSFVVEVAPAQVPVAPTTTPTTRPAVAADPVNIAVRTRTGFSTQLVARGGTGGFTWTATGVPAGVMLSSTGLVSGSVALPGTYVVPVTVASGQSSTTTTVTLTVTRHRPLSFTSAKRLPAGRVGDRYVASVVTQGAEGLVTWKKSGALPPGLTVVRRKAGRLAIAGRPTEAGTYAVRLVAVDASGARTARRFTVRITRWP